VLGRENRPGNTEIAPDQPVDTRQTPAHTAIHRLIAVAIEFGATRPENGEATVTEGSDATLAGALETDRLRRDLLDARDEIAATNDVLTAMGRSASDLDLVLGTIVDRARQLCRADGVQLHLVDGSFYRLARSSGLTADFVEHMTNHPILRDHNSLTGRVGLDRRTTQITDVLADPGYGRQDAQRIAGYRTIMGAPMMLDDDVVGVLIVWRTEVDPFEDRAITQLTAFAAAAAIAVRNLDLVRALEARTAELGNKVDQLEALGQIGEAVSSSLDLDMVLSTIVAHAVQLSGTDGGSLMEFDETQQVFFVRTAYGTSAEVLDKLRQANISLHHTFVGRAALEGRPLQVADMHGPDLDVHQQLLHDAGWRSMVAVPMLREGRIVGVLVVRRQRAGDFPDETCELLQTFASQSALAILNARLFRELEVKTRELEVVSRHKSEFLASMSHELRTPLNAVIGFSEVLLDRMFGEINDRQQEYLRDIWSSGKHLLQLLTEILDLSKVEAGHMELDNVTFSVRDALDYGLSMIRERAAQHSLRLTLDVDSSVGLAYADELRFKQVLLNLLSNAAKFTPDGGEIRVGATTAEGNLSITVTDTGLGVAPEDRERIFESFQQGPRGASTQEGTGLGLTLCRRIVGLMGGQMWLDTEVGVGSTFGFTVPLGSPRLPDGGPSTAREELHLPRVVVIEDDRPSLDLLTVYLETVGLEVESAPDGPTGLDAIRRQKPVAVVLDIRLPRIDGWDVLVALRADPETAALPVVVVSMLDERAKGLSLGATEYLVKPVSREQLLAALARAGVASEPLAAARVHESEPR
jgi:signal transduction histidine kinase/ActR/RegA family two-component response regulator